MLLRETVHAAEDEEPYEPQRSGDDERRTPRAEEPVQSEHEKGRHRSADRGAAVEERHCPAALAAREPLGNRLRGPGPVRRLAGTEQEPESAEAPEAGRCRCQHRGDRVPRHADAQTCTCAEPIKGAPRDGLSYRVRSAKRNDDEGEVRVRPVEILLEERRQDTQRLTIDVVDDRGCEEQSTDVPAEPFDGPDRRLRRGGPPRHSLAASRVVMPSTPAIVLPVSSARTASRTPLAHRTVFPVCY